jgi:hypothetical protein
MIQLVMASKKTSLKLTMLELKIPDFLMELKQVLLFLIFANFNLLGQAYIMSLKNGNNSIIIVGASNAAYDPNMTELYPEWEEAIKESMIV